MLNDAGDVLYVGKAKQLKKRVESYTNVAALPNRLQRMVFETTKMLFTTTHTEAEALLLESNLIKTLEPRYNILLRDDKSLPYVLITKDHDFPLLTKHRGAQRRKGKYFGPFANGGYVNETILTLQKVFQLRNCSDNMFANRSRPCLQYHIKRCTAPCVGKVSKAAYAKQVKEAEQLLAGQTGDVQTMLADKMQAASDAMDYETAAVYRDRIQALTKLQNNYQMHQMFLPNADVFVAVRIAPWVCLHLTFFRNNQHYGDQALFMKVAEEETDENIFSSLLAQFYESHQPPKDIYLNFALDDKQTLNEAFAANFLTPKRGAKMGLVQRSVENATLALERKLKQNKEQADLLIACANLFDIDDPLNRIEVYDNSHIGGQNAVGAMIVHENGQFNKAAYRRFNIKDQALSPGDDYGMLREVLTRRLKRSIKEEEETGQTIWPDLLLIDGGKGQLSSAVQVLEELGLAHIPVVAIAKGEKRNAGEETLFLPNQTPIKLPKNDQRLYFLQRLRDEVHRYAIGSHRKAKTKSTIRSDLDNIPGIGAKRRKALLHHFGSLKEISRAGVKDLCKVEGISVAFAQKIYDYFNETG